MDLEKQNIITTRYVIYGIIGSLIFGAILLFSVMYMVGVFGTKADEELMKSYKEDKAKSEKILQAALVEAEKNRKEAEAQRKANDELYAKFTERDKKRDLEIVKNDERRKQENENIQQQYVQDIDRSNTLSPDELSRDNCARLERLAESNPGLAQFKCNLSNSP